MKEDEFALTHPKRPRGRARRWVTLIAVALVLSLATGAVLVLRPSAGVSADEHVTRALEYYKNKDLRSATIELKNALQLNPDDAAARWLLAQVRLASGDGAAALKEIEHARRLGRQGSEVEKARVQALVLIGRYDEALDWLNTQSDLDTDSYLLKARAHLGLREVQAARASFEEALRRNPDNAEARLGLARVAVAMRDSKEAEKQLAATIEQGGGDTEAWMLKGELEMTRRDFPEAQKAFERALAQSPDSPTTQLALARALLAQGEVQTAEEHIDRVLKAYPSSPMANYFRAVAALQRENIEAATAALREVLSVSPTHAPSLLMMGGIHYQKQELEQAAEVLKKLLSVAPGSVQGTKLLAAVYLRQGNAGKAIEMLEPLLEVAPQDAQLLAMLGSAYMTERDFARATELLSAAAKVAPDVAAIRTQLGVSHLAAGDTRVGMEALESAVELDPGFARADFILALVNLQQRRFDETLAIARRLSEREPENPVPFNLMAAAYEGQGDTDKARELYERALSVLPSYQTAKLNLARLDLIGGDTAAARSRYNEVLQAQPNNYVALTSLARLLLHTQQVAETVKLLEQARESKARGVDARLLLSTIYRGSRRTGDALEIAEEAAAIAPKEPKVLLVLAQAQLAAGQVDASVQTCERAAELDPQSHQAAFQLGLAQVQAGRLDAAKTAFRRALELAPDFLAADLSLAAIAVREGHPEQALQIAADIKDRFPERADGYMLEGEVRMREEDFESAVQQFETALQHAQTNRVVLKLAGAQRANGHPERAQRTLADWLERHPDDVPVRLSLADSYLQGERQALAQEQYEAVLQHQPNNALALNNLAWIYHESGDDRALEHARRAYETVPERAEIIDTYGWLLVQSGNVQRGIALLDNAVEKAPQITSIRYHLAAGLAEAGERRKARETLALLLASGEDFSEREAAQTLLDKLNSEKILEVLDD